MRAIIFSRYFPAYHPKKGEPTFFVEKILRNFWKEPKWINQEVQDAVGKYTKVVGPIANVNHFSTKEHTIRSGKRWKVGDVFSPRIWSGKPYASKQIEFAPPIMITQTIDVKIGIDAPHYTYILVPQKKNDTYIMLPATDVARNDGLSFEDFQEWFKPYCKTKDDYFEGQIIIWSDINYSGNLVKAI